MSTNRTLLHLTETGYFEHVYIYPYLLYVKTLDYCQFSNMRLTKNLSLSLEMGHYLNPSFILNISIKVSIDEVSEKSI